MDPFYPIYEAEQRTFSAELIRTVRAVNEYVPKRVGDLAHEMSENPVLVDVDGTFEDATRDDDLLYRTL